MFSLEFSFNRRRKLSGSAGATEKIKKVNPLDVTFFWNLSLIFLQFTDHVNVLWAVDIFSDQDSRKAVAKRCFRYTKGGLLQGKKTQEHKKQNASSCRTLESIYNVIKCNFYF